MARHDVHIMPGRDEGYVLDVQAELLSYLETRVVVPLLPKGTAPPAISELNPVFEIEGRPYVMMTQALGAVSNHELRRAVASLTAQTDAITKALDLLLIGF